VSDEDIDATAFRREAFTALYRRLLPAVRGQVRLWVAADEVDEIVSSTFVTAWHKFEQITPGSEKAWLLGVARNHARNRFRSRRRSDALTEAVARLAAPPTADLYADRPDPVDFAPLLRALENLERDEQELLELSIWQELTPAEIAIVLDVRQGTVRVRLHRARRRLEVEYDRLTRETEAE
jgi:RNA polymerase sigma-70 factor (ECF subfamily)